MVNIPPPSETDSDDVVWAIQTAITQLERGDVEDAVVWLRRGAQSAAQADDDARALELARVAAELAESVAPTADAEGPPVSLELDPLSIRQGIFTVRGPSAKAPPPPPIRPALTQPDDDDEVVTSAPPMEQIAILRALSTTGPQAVVAAPAGLPPPPTKPDKPVPLDPIPVATVSGFDVSDRKMSPSDVSTGDEPTQPSADLGDTNDVAAANSGARDAEPPLVESQAPQHQDEVTPEPRPPEPSLIDVEPVSEDSPQVQQLAAAPSVSSKAPPPPPMHAPRTESPPAPKEKPPPLALVEPLVPEPAIGTHQAEQPALGPPLVEARPPAERVDLSSIELFEDMPEETREEFQRSATRHTLLHEEEVSGFGLVIVVSGDTIVASLVSDMSAVQLTAGSVLRSRGTVDERVAVRIVCSSESATVMTWTEEDVARYLEALPWVEEDLRAEADRVHAAVGATLGPLGQSFDAAMLQGVVKRFDVRQLLPEETLMNAGEPLPGLGLLGVGDLEVEGHPSPAIGDLLFPSALLDASPIPSSVRAGPRGAVVLWMGLSEAQELLMVFPPLLDLITRSRA